MRNYILGVTYISCNVQRYLLASSDANSWSRYELVKPNSEQEYFLSICCFSRQWGFSCRFLWLFWNCLQRIFQQNVQGYESAFYGNATGKLWKLNKISPALDLVYDDFLVNIGFLTLPATSVPLDDRIDKHCLPIPQTTKSGEDDIVQDQIKKLQEHVTSEHTFPNRGLNIKFWKQIYFNI